MNDERELTIREMIKYMEDKKIHALYEKAIKKWGYTAQIDMMVEECSELIKAIQKRKRANVEQPCINDILEEMADVEIMVEQLKLIFDYEVSSLFPTTKFQRIKKNKLERLEKLLNED